MKCTCDTKPEKVIVYSNSSHIPSFLRNELMLCIVTFQVSIEPVRRAFKLDSSHLTLKAMPGLTSVHLQPNGFEKMRVALAFQLFGNHVINGLHFYKEKLESSWGDIDPTIAFFR